MNYVYINNVFFSCNCREKKNILPNYQFGERNTVIWDYVTDDFLPKKNKTKKDPKKVELVSLLCLALACFVHGK